MKTVSLRCGNALLALCCLALFGCGKPDDGSFEVRGRMLRQGKPIEVQGVEQGLGWVKLQLWKLDAAGKPGETPIECSVRPDGGFVLSGIQGNGKKGLLPGMYMISAEIEQNGKRLFPEHSRETSKASREFMPTDEEVVIELKP